MAADRVELPGSHRAPALDASVVDEPVAADEPIEVTVTLRGAQLPDDVGTPLSRDELADRFGASQADADAVRDALQSEGLQVVDVSLPTRSMRVRGTARQFESALGVHFVRYESAEQGRFRGRQGALSLPGSIAHIVTGIFGLDDRRVARRKTAEVVQARPLTPADIEARYAFPSGDCSGLTVAIAEFGGAYFAQDAEAYCAKYDRPLPDISPISAGWPLYTLDQIQQMPKQQQNEIIDESVEVMMDVELVAGLCAGAEVPVFFAPFTEKGWVDLLNAVMTFDPTPVVLSISWGLAEDSSQWSQSALEEINARLHAAAAMGVTVCVASGDDGAGDGTFDGQPHVDFPASSRWVLAVGGTMLDGDDEVVWWQAPGDRAHGGGSSGGGVSTVWARPPRQSDVQVSPLPGAGTGRIVPDVAAVAGAPFYDVIVLGQDSPNGGTSAATPVWASVIARVAAGLPADRQLRWLAPLLYADTAGGAPMGSVACTDITSGNNASTGVDSGYAASTGFDAVTGWGSPNGTALRSQLEQI